MEESSAPNELDPERQLDEWIGRLAQGDPDATERAFAEYFDPLVRAVRKRLGSLPRREVDEEDIAISAMESFLRGATEGKFPRLQERNDPWRVLVTIAGRKVARLQRSRLAQKRGEGAVRGESVFMQASATDGDVLTLAEVLGTTPSVELVSETIETLQELFSQLKDSLAASVVEQRLAGFSNQEIADDLGVTPRTVERKLRTIRERWMALSK